jgi:hypothetical protein
MKQLINTTMKSLINTHSIRPYGLGRAITFSFLALALFTGTSLMGKGREADLPSPQCDSLNVPAGNRVSAHVYALGVQIYRWNGTSWAFVGPDATLYADQGFNGQVGTHYVGPTWEAEDGSKVVADKFSDCLPNRGAIPWLRLDATSSSPQGRFGGVTHVLRVNTIGGTAPATAGTFVGDEARVPYTAEYYFYRAAVNE